MENDVEVEEESYKELGKKIVIEAYERKVEQNDSHYVEADDDDYEDDDDEEFSMVRIIIY